MTRRSWQNPIVRALAADPLVLAYLAVFIGEVLFYLTPMASPAFREQVGLALFMAPFVALVLAGTLLELDRLPRREERRFWQTLAVSGGAWLAAILVKSVCAGDAYPRAIRLSLDTLFLASYLPLLLAAELRPHQRAASTPKDPLRWANVVAVSIVCAGWFVYLVLVPVLIEPDASGSSFSASLLFLFLDVTLVGLYVSVGRRCRIRRWRVLYWAMAAAALALGLSDTLDMLVQSNVLDWRAGQPTDLLWLPQSFALLIAVRLRHAPLGPADAVESESPGFTLEERSRTGGMILAGAFSFPLVHLWLYSAISGSDALERAQSIVVLVMLGVLGVVAVATYRVLGQRYEELAWTQRILEGRLREAQRLEAVGRLAGGVSHDFNNILTSIVGYNDLALEALPADDPNRPALEEIARAAARASDLTSQLLALSRRQILKPERINLSRVVEDIRPTLARIIGEDVQIDTHLAPRLFDVLADPSQVRWAVLTLTANARAAMPGGGALVITTANARVTGDSWPIDPGRAPGDYAELTMADTGPEIPIPDQPHVFEPFYSSRPQGRGTGLGLAAVHGIVTQSGGTIDVRSGPAGGAEFVIRLPRALDLIPR
jgi:signal transduction histidine kinase